MTNNSRVIIVRHKRLSKSMLAWCDVTPRGPVQVLPWKLAEQQQWSDDTVEAIEQHNSAVEMRKAERALRVRSYERSEGLKFP